MELPLPIELAHMIRTGFWPSTPEAANAQNLKQTIPKERIIRFAPEEEQLFLYPPPFYTVEQQMKGEKGNVFWNHPMAAVHEIEPALALDIGDFGIGSDAALILDYRHDRLNPSVLRLRWSTDRQKPPFSDNHWVEVASNFATFANYLR